MIGRKKDTLDPYKRIIYNDGTVVFFSDGTNAYAKHLDILDDIDYDRLRCTIASEVLSNIVHLYMQEREGDRYRKAAEEAIRFSDELVKQLRQR